MSLPVQSWIPQPKRAKPAAARPRRRLPLEQLETRRLLASVPIAQSDAYSGLVGLALEIVDQSVLDNDVDLDRDPLVAVLVDSPSNGSVDFNDDGTFGYTPDPGFRGTDSFTYQAVTRNPTIPFQVIRDESEATVDVELFTALGSDRDDDSSSLTGELDVRVIPDIQPFNELFVSGMELIVADGADVSFSFFLAGISASIPPDPSPDPQLAPIRLSMEQPGDAAEVVDGAFIQAENTFSITGIAHLDATGLASAAIDDGPVPLDNTGIVTDLAGVVSQNGNEVTIRMPVSFAGAFDINEETSVDLTMAGSVVARGPVVTESEKSNIATVTIVIEDGPPVVLDAGFNSGLTDPADLSTGPQPTSWAKQRSLVRRLEVTFSETVIPTVQSFRLVNLGVNANQDPDVLIELSEDQMQTLGDKVVFEFEPDDLENGVYQLEVLSSVTDIDGAALDGDRDGVAGGDFTMIGDDANRLFRMTADWNGDAGASIFDFSTFAYWFGVAVPEAPRYVDLNKDEGVSIFDFSPYAAVFGSGLTFPPLALAANNRAGWAFVQSEQAPLAHRARRTDDRKSLDSSDLKSFLAQWMDDRRPIRESDSGGNSDQLVGEQRDWLRLLGLASRMRASFTPFSFSIPDYS